MKKSFHGLWESCLRVGFFASVWGRWGRWAGWPPDWGGWAGSPGPLRVHTSGYVWCGERLVVIPAWWQESFEKSVLDGANTWSLIRPGHESSVRSAQLIRRWVFPGNLPLGQTLVMGRSWWEVFWVGCGWFFSWGDGGGEEETPGHGLLSRFRRTTRVSEQPFLCDILYIEQWEFHYIKFQSIVKSTLDLDALDRHFQWVEEVVDNSTTSSTHWRQCRYCCTSFHHGLIDSTVQWVWCFIHMWSWSMLYVIWVICLD